MRELKSAAGRAGAPVRGGEAERRAEGAGEPRCRRRRAADPGEARPRRPCLPVRRCGVTLLQEQVSTVTRQLPPAFLFILFSSVLIGNANGGGLGGWGSTYLAKLAAVLRRALCPTAAPGWPPPRVSAACPEAQRRVGTAFAVVLGQAKGCGVFLGTVISSKTLRSRGGGESRRRVVCVWKGKPVIIGINNSNKRRRVMNN